MVAGRRESLQVIDLLGKAPRPADQPEVAVLDLQGHGPSGRPMAPDAVPCEARHPLQFTVEVARVAIVGVESPFRADRLGLAAASNGPFIDPAADPPIPFARTAESALEFVHVELL